MPATSRTIVRAYTKEGYHRDILVLDSEQVRMHHTGLQEQPPGGMTSYKGPCMTIYPSDFPEMVAFEVIVEEYKR